MSPKNDQFATLIRDRRTALGLSMQQLADQVGVTKSNVHYWEAGQGLPKAGVLGKLAGALGVSDEDLFTLAGYTRPTGLPTWSPYLRTKYGHLPEDALDELEGHMRRLEAESGGADVDGA